MSNRQDDLILELLRQKRKLRRSNKDSFQELLDKKTKQLDSQSLWLIKEEKRRARAIEADFGTKVHQILNLSRIRRSGSASEDMQELIRDIEERSRPQVADTESTKPRGIFGKKKRNHSVWAEFLFPMIILTFMFLFLPPDLEHPQRFKALANFRLGLADPMGTLIVAIAIFLHIFMLPRHLMRLWRKMSVNYE